jgi:hypothetical protein
MMPNFRIKPWFICSTNIDYFGWNAKKVMGNCRSTVIPPLINSFTNDIVVNESDKANVLNNYFCSISSTANNIDPRLKIYFKGKYTVSAVFFNI